MNKFDKLSVFVECSTGNTPRVKTVKKLIDMLSEMGYRELYLGCTDAYKIEGEPYFNYKRGGYTAADFREMDAYAAAHGMELVASIQTLAHLHYLKKHDVYKELFDTEDILLVGDERVYAFIEKMLGAISAGISCRRIHLGFDEAFTLGKGEYLRRNGYRDPKQILLDHLERVADIAGKKFGYTCEIWADMLLEERAGSLTAQQIAARLPENVRLIAWNYTMREEDQLRRYLEACKASGREVSFAGAAWKICGFAPSNRYSISVALSQMKVCSEMGIGRYMLTLWSDGGGMVSDFAVLPALYAAAEYAYGRIGGEEEIDEKLDRERFRRITGAEYDDLASLDYLNDPFRKNLLTLNSRSYWILYSDLLFGNYDRYLSRGTGERYAALAADYAEKAKGPFAHLFAMSSAYASVLAVKSELGPEIRAAYRAGDRKALSAALGKAGELKTRMNEFIKVFEDYWLRDNSAFGLDVLHLFFGGQVVRYSYVEKRISEYLADGGSIEEMEGIELDPSVIPQTDEDRCFEMNYRNLISFCGI